MRRFDRAVLRRGLAVGVAASMVLVGVTVAATSVRAVEVAPELMKWSVVALTAVGAWGSLTGRRRWAAVPLLAPLFLWVVWAGTEGDLAPVGPPALGPMPLSGVLTVVGVTVVGVAVAGRADGVDRLASGAVGLVGVGGLVLVDPVAVALAVAVLAGVLSVRWPVAGVAGSVILSAVGGWLGLVWWFAPNRGTPPVLAVIGVVVAAGLAVVWRAVATAARSTRPGEGREHCPGTTP